MFMLQSLEYYSSMFDGIMLSGDDYIAHYLILIKPEKSDIVEEERMFHGLRSPPPCCYIPFLKISELCLGCFVTLTSFSSPPDTMPSWACFI